MANITTNKAGVPLATAFSAYRGADIGGFQILEVTVDSGNTAGMVATDTMDVAVIPKNSVILGAQVILDTTASTPDVVEGGTSTINIGDGTTANLFGAAVNLNGAVNTFTDSADTFYSTAGVVKITCATGTVKKARFRVRLMVVNLGS